MKQLRENEYLIHVKNDGVLEEGVNVRYNGGWAKELTGLNKAQNNGYSIVGNWCDKGVEYRVWEGKLYLDCNVTGSRKNHSFHYALFTVKNGKIVIIQRKYYDYYDKHWAVEMWENIEKFLNAEKKTEKKNPLEKFTDEQLIAELQSRGHDVKLDEEVFPAEARTEKSRFAALEMK